MAQTSAGDFGRLVAVNARGPFLMMQAAAQRLADGGRVVNMTEEQKAFLASAEAGFITGQVIYVVGGPVR